MSQSSFPGWPLRSCSHQILAVHLLMNFHLISELVVYLHKISQLPLLVVPLEALPVQEPWVAILHITQRQKEARGSQERRSQAGLRAGCPRTGPGKDEGGCLAKAQATFAAARLSFPKELPKQFSWQLIAVQSCR